MAMGSLVGVANGGRRSVGQRNKSNSPSQWSWATRPNDGQVRRYFTKTGTGKNRPRQASSPSASSTLVTTQVYSPGSRPRTTARAFPSPSIGTSLARTPGRPRHSTRTCRSGRRVEKFATTSSGYADSRNRDGSLHCYGWPSNEITTTSPSIVLQQESPCLAVT